MNYNKLKKTHKDEAKQRARFFMMLEDYKTKSLEELQEIFKTKKLSSTDRTALIHAADLLAQKQMDEMTKMSIKEEIEGE